MTKNERPTKTYLQKDPDTPGDRLYAPAVARNRIPIRDVIQKHLPARGTVLEIASGSGEHAIFIASANPDLLWHTSDPDPAARRSIKAWMEDAALANLFGPRKINAADEDWQLPNDMLFDAIVSINMVHISPFNAAQGLFRGAAKYTANDDGPQKAKLLLYGPFTRNGEHTSASNVEFDQSLKARDQRWGVRDLDNEILPLAKKYGFSLSEIVEMPANNLSVIFEKDAPTKS